MPMQSSWVDSLFGRLMVRYGRAFVAQYEGIDLDVVKADWASALDGVTADRVRFALEHLPADRPPNALQFRAICREMNAASTGELARLSADPAQPTPEQREAIRAAIAGVVATDPTLHPGRYCMERLRTFEARHGQKLNPAQRFQLDALERMYGTPEPADLRREPLDLRREPIEMPRRTEAA